MSVFQNYNLILREISLFSKVEAAVASNNSLDRTISRSVYRQIIFILKYLRINYKNLTIDLKTHLISNLNKNQHFGSSEI